MSAPRGHVHVYRGQVPFWLVLAVVAPLGLVFLTSLVLAVALAGAAAALVTLFLPRMGKRAAPDAPNTIDLDPSQYHRIDARPPRDPH